MLLKIRSLWVGTLLWTGLTVGVAHAEAVEQGEARLTRRVSGDIPMRKGDSGMDRDLAHYTRPHEFKSVKRQFRVRESGAGGKHASARKPAHR